MASEKVSRKMVLEIKYVNANNTVIHTENSKVLLDLNCKLVTGILAKISLGTGIWYPPSRPSMKIQSGGEIMRDASGQQGAAGQQGENERQ